MPRSKSKSTHVFEVRLWSREYYEKPKSAKDQISVWNGLVINRKDTKKKSHFHSAGDLLKTLEKFYFDDESKK